MEIYEGSRSLTQIWISLRMPALAFRSAAGHGEEVGLGRMSLWPCIFILGSELSVRTCEYWQPKLRLHKQNMPNTVKGCLQCVTALTAKAWMNLPGPLRLHYYRLKPPFATSNRMGTYLTGKIRYLGVSKTILT